MKYQLEKDEFQAIHNTLLQMTTIICETIKFGMERSHKYQMEELRYRKLSETGNKGLGISNNTVVDDVFPELQFDKHNNDSESLHMEMFSTFEEKDLTSHQINGKHELVRLLEFWLENFKDDNLPQPDRNEYIEKLAQDGKRAGSIVSYAMAMGGLTKAIWNAVDSSDSLTVFYSTWSTSDKAKEIRYVAGNITQVSSVHLHPLADQFDYPNPIHFLYED